MKKGILAVVLWLVVMLIIWTLFILSSSNNKNIETTDVVLSEQENDQELTISQKAEDVNDEPEYFVEDFILSIEEAYGIDILEETPLYNYINDVLYREYGITNFITKIAFEEQIVSIYKDLSSDFEGNKTKLRWLLLISSELGISSQDFIDINDWIETHGVSPSSIRINYLVDYFYSLENPDFVWDPDSVEDGKYTYIQWVFEFLTFCEKYNKESESIFKGYENSELKKEYYDEYLEYKKGEIHKNTIKNKYKDRQKLYLSEWDFTEPSFIETMTAIYDEKKLNCWEIIIENYEKVEALWNIQ